MLAVVCYILSALVIWSEVSLAIPVDLSPFGKLTQVSQLNSYDHHYDALDCIACNFVYIYTM
jgi:hypothetical protein